MNFDELKVLGFRHEFELFCAKTGEVVHREVKFNRIPRRAIDFLIQSPFGDAPPINDFYCSLYRNNVLSDATMTAADLPGVLGEFMEYSETTRPVWERTYNGAGSYSNADARAVFTATAQRDIYGSVIVSNPVKGAPDGMLLSVVRFATVKKISPEHPGRLLCGLTYIPTNLL